MASKARKGEKTKAVAIRDVVTANPKLKTSEVVAALKAKGVDVSSNHVYLIRSKAKGRKRRQRREAVAALVSRTGMANPIQVVGRLKVIAAELGGLPQLKQLVDLLAT
jgi:hypothetical protein